MVKIKHTTTAKILHCTVAEAAFPISLFGPEVVDEPACAVGEVGELVDGLELALEVVDCEGEPELVDGLELALAVVGCEGEPELVDGLDLALVEVV